MYIYIIWKLIYKKNEKRITEYKDLINSLPTPSDDLERAFDNYIVNNQGLSSFAKIILNICGLIGSILVLFIYSYNRLFAEKSEKKCKAVVIDATNRFGVKYNTTKFFPDVLKKEFMEMQFLEVKAFPGFFEGIISRDVINIWITFVKRHPFNLFLSFRCLMNLAGYKKIIYTFHPLAIINSRVEVNNMSSIVTMLCEKNDCEYICFMHGDIRNDPLTAFVRFSRFYLWDTHYISILNWARCDEHQYRIYDPPAIVQRKKNATTKSPSKIITYFLSGNTETGKDKNIKNIINALEKLNKCGYKCYIRPHPRWSDINEIEELLSKGNIHYEDSNIVSIEDSLERTYYCCGLHSTILIEALYNHNCVVIDDVSDKELYTHLIDVNFIVLSKAHSLLSDLIKEAEEYELR